MPKPNPEETQKDFVSRCMGDPEANKSFPNQDQRYAVCNSLYKQAKKKQKAKGSAEEPVWEDHKPKNAWIY